MIEKIKQAILSKLQTLAVQKLSALLMTMGAAVLGLSINIENYLAQYMPTPPQLWEVRLFALILVLMIALVSLFLWYRPWLVVSQIDGGCWLDKKTGIRYCVSCKTKYNQLVPLNEETTRWSCPVVGCWQVYSKKNNNC